MKGIFQMQIEKKELKKSAVELVIKIEPDEFEPYEKQAFNTLATQVKVKGFRAGKIPENILKQHVIDDQVFSEALEKALPIFFYKAIEQEKQITVAAPEIKIDKYEKGKPIVIRAKVDIMPDFKAPDYKKVKIKLEKVKVKETDIGNTIKELQRNFSETRPKLEPSAKGDRIEIDFEGFIDNVRIDSLCSKNHPLVIGESQFIPGFEKELIGLNQGDEKEFNLDLPKDLRDPLAAGKKSRFKLKINQLQRIILPEIDDEFAKKFSKFKTLNQLKEDIKKSIIKRNEAQAEKKAELEMISKITDLVKFDVPESSVKQELGRMVNDIATDIQKRGLQFEDYLKSLNKTQDQFISELRPQAEKAVKIALVISKLKADFKIKALDSEIVSEIENLKKMGQKIEANDETKRYFKHVIGNRKTIEKLKKECIVK